MISETLQLTSPEISGISSVPLQPSFPEWNIETPPFRNGKFVKPDKAAKSPITESPQAINISINPNTQLMLEGWEHILYQRPTQKKTGFPEAVRYRMSEGKQPELAPYQVLKDAIQLTEDFRTALYGWNEDVDRESRIKEFKVLTKREKDIPKYWESFGDENKTKVWHPIITRLDVFSGTYFELAINEYPEIVKLLGLKAWDGPQHIAFILTATGVRSLPAGYVLHLEKIEAEIESHKEDDWKLITSFPR